MNNLEKYLDQVIEQRPAVYDSPSEIEPETPTTTNFLQSLRRRWYIVVLVTIAVCAVGIPAVWMLVEPVYVVQGAVNVAPTVPAILSDSVPMYGGGGYQEFVNTQSLVLMSTPILQRIADDLAGRGLALLSGRPQTRLDRLMARVQGAKSAPDPAKILKNAVNAKKVSAGHIRGTTLLAVSMRGPNVGEARQVVDSFLRNYQAMYDTLANQEENENLRVLEGEQQQLQTSIRNQRDHIVELSKEFGTTVLDSRQEMEMQRMGVLMTEWTRLEAERISSEATVLLLEQMEPNMPLDQIEAERSARVNSDPLVAQLAVAIVQMKRDLLVAQQSMMEGNPALSQRRAILKTFEQTLEDRRKELEAEFDERLDELVAAAARRQLSAAQSRHLYVKAHQDALGQILAEQDRTTREIGLTNLDIQNTQFQLQLDEEMHGAISRRIKTIEMERQRRPRITPAYDAELRATEDKRPKLAATVVFGALCCGFGLALLRDKMDKTLQTPDDVTKHLELPIIGTTTSSRTIKPALFAEQIAGDYQTIRTNLGLLNNGGMPKRLVVCSAGMREGKTTFAVNLATSVAKSGKKVLLIDGDLRKPDIGFMLNIGNGSGGLQDVLLGEDPSGIVSTLSSSGLHVLAANPRHLSDPYELLTSASAAEQIDRLSRDYDHLIIDTPPALAFPDALVWAKLVEAVVLVGFAGQTRTPELKEAKERFTRIKARVLGAVLSNVPVDQSLYRYAYSYRAQGTQTARKARKPRKLLLPTHGEGEGETEDTV